MLGMWKKLQLRQWERNQLVGLVEGDREVREVVAGEEKVWGGG